jgi:dephospho-CoA kinase
VADPVFRPFRVGLTGSIGMGKSETAKLFARLGLPVFDADAAVHLLYAPAGEGTAAIKPRFPQAVTAAGGVDRSRLADIIASDPAALRALETLVHPLVRKAEDRFVDAAAQRGDDLVILDIPLLFETGRDKTMDAIVVVSAPEAVQRARVLKRPGMTAEKLAAMLERQVPDVDKRARADFVIETDKGLDHALAQVKRVAAELKRRALEQRGE